jgi:hypothetical protein
MFSLKGNNDRASLFLQSICLQPIYGERAVDPFLEKKEVAQKEEGTEGHLTSEEDG